MITIKHDLMWGVSVTCDCVWQDGIKIHPNTTCDDLCTTHTIGYLKGKKDPNYPLPTVRANNITGGGIKGFFTYCAPMFVDWSRGQLEVY